MKESKQNATMLRYTKAAMLEEWKIRTGYFTTRRGCDIVRDDGVDLDSLLQAEIDSRYESLLAGAPAEMVPVMDITDDCEVLVDSSLGVTIVFPPDCVRVVELMLPGWKRSVTEFAPPSGNVAAMQRNEWLRAGTENPVCIAGHRSLYACSAVSAADYKPAKLLAVCRPEEGIYVFAPTAWDFLLRTSP